MRHYRYQSLLALLFFTVLYIHHAIADNSGELRTTDYFLSHLSNEPFYEQHGLDQRVVLHVREVVLSGRERTAGRDNKVLLFIHGATFPGTVAFDVDYENASMMRHFARLGWDTFTFDFQGYGLSTRPLVMDAPNVFPNSQAPMKTDVTVADVGRVVDFIQNLRGVEKIHLLGWSLGATLEAPLFAIRQPDKVAKLILYAGEYQWPASDEKRQQKIAEYNAEKVRYGAITSVQNNWAWSGTKETLVIPGAFDAYRQAHLASDPKSGELGGAARWPLGRHADSWLESPHFDASKITVPTLVIRGAADTFATKEDNEALLTALGSNIKKYVEIPNAGHFMQFEKTNAEFYQALQDFLEPEQN